MTEQHVNAYQMEGRWCCKRRPHWDRMPDRKIIINEPDLTLCNNMICTSKYTKWNFIPLNLFEQFSKMANLYFLIIGYFETVRPISITDGQPVIWFPLFLVVCISSMKDYFEDHKRHVSDNAENKRRTSVLTENGFTECEWQNIRVGDIIKVECDEYFPADVTILGGIMSKGRCFIETKNLDGETNLKVKKVPRKVMYMSQLTHQALYEQRLLMSYEKPNPYLYKFEGLLEGEFQEIVPIGSGTRSSRSSVDGEDDQRCPLDSVNFVLRGCSLKNTQMVFGVVAYTGHDTKILLNSTSARMKRSHLDETMNFFIILVFFIQIVICLFCAQYNSLWQERYLKDVGYLEFDENDPESKFFVNLLYKWGTWLLIFTNFVPISLLVTLEMVKFLQGIQIHDDPQCKECVVQSSCLNEELGQIDYIFSDKTGTITKNLMEFKMFSVGGKLYGQQTAQMDRPQVDLVDFSDPQFFKDLKSDQYGPILVDFMVHLAACHTIITTKDDEGRIKYNASSPDELALANGAKYCGFQFLGNDDKGFLVVRQNMQYYRFQVLQILEFTSARKRMSIIVRTEDGKIMIMTKGADTILEKLLEDSPIKQKTWQHLSIMAQSGLRTLLIAQRVIPELEYKQWINVYEEATMTFINRDEAIEKAQAMIEVKLELLGATGIEDKLQDEVKSTMEALQKAKIKIWVLTGDKQETAINIAYSCGILSDDIHKLFIDADQQVQVSYQLQACHNLLERSFGLPCTLILSGDSLIHLVHPRYAQRLMAVARQCRSVICCRVSPKQKQEVVSLVIAYEKNITTLAVGDGANDVNMITAAHIGIGVKGVEGNQAARAADYVIPEFKILRPLILNHGRECYRRNMVVVGYNFYKNLVVVLPHFWYSFNNGFSASNLYDPWLYQFYNMFYTSLPIVLYAVYDNEYSSNFLTSHPLLYSVREEISLMTFFEWFLLGWYQSAVIAYSCFPSFESTTLDSSGKVMFLSCVGMGVFCYAIIVVNFKIMIISFTYSWMNIIVIIISVGFLFLSYLTLSVWTVQLDISQTFLVLVRTWHFWGVLAVLFVITILVDLGLWRWKNFMEQRLVEDQKAQPISPAPSFINQNPSVQSNNPRESQAEPPKEYENFIEEDDESQPLLPLLPSQSKIYTGYGFAQQERVLDSALQNAEN